MVAAGESSSDLERGAAYGEAVELALPNAIDAIAQALPVLEQFITAHDLAPAPANRIQVIFEELASNAIRHGFTPGSDQSVHVRIRAAADHVELAFEDDGAPFNPFEQTPPGAIGPVETARLGGLGIPLVRKMSASTRYERPAGTGGPFRPVNRVVVTVAR